MSEAHQPAADLTTSIPESWRAELARGDSPDERIGVIEDSLRCFAFGWLTLLPVVGVAWLYPAVRRFASARRRKVEWNPARGYLAAGLALASGGWLMALVSWLFLLNLLAIASDFVVRDGDLLEIFPVVLFLGAVPALVGLVLGWATVWDWLANLSVRIRWGVAAVAVLGYSLIGLGLNSGSARWAEPEWERTFRWEMTVLGIWCVWLFGGFILLARRNVQVRGWMMWLAALAGLSFFVARL